jgi:hypothetical protein
MYHAINLIRVDFHHHDGHTRATFCHQPIFKLKLRSINLLSEYEYDTFSKLIDPLLCSYFIHILYQSCFGALSKMLHNLVT